MSDAFCREVYGVVRDVPAGKVISYGEIASLLGKPQCSRMAVSYTHLTLPTTSRV